MMAKLYVPMHVHGDNQGSYPTNYSLKARNGAPLLGHLHPNGVARIPDVVAKHRTWYFPRCHFRREPALPIATITIYFRYEEGSDTTDSM